MSEESSNRRNNALDFLDELDERHDFLLNELEQLNLRIDAVLNDYSKSRQSAAIANGVVADHHSQVVSLTDASNYTDEAAEFD
ncbi:MAG: hypothetical protein SFV81_13710 [Pirellulaceae bacterium]|nr:hypothetical protein [Pirellulaceae bacterium]